MYKNVSHLNVILFHIHIVVKLYIFFFYKDVYYVQYRIIMMIITLKVA